MLDAGIRSTIQFLMDPSNLSNGLFFIFRLEGKSTRKI